MRMKVADRDLCDTRPSGWPRFRDDAGEKGWTAEHGHWSSGRRLSDERTNEREGLLGDIALRRTPAARGCAALFPVALLQFGQAAHQIQRSCSAYPVADEVLVCRLE